MVVEQAKSGEWAVWANNRRFLARFPTEAEARAFAASHCPAPAPYVRPQPKLTKLEALVLARIEAKGTAVWPGVSDAVSGLVRKGMATAIKLPGGTYRITPTHKEVA